MTITTPALQGDTLDLICWRELGTTAGGVVEQAFELNRGVAGIRDHGTALLAEGMVIVLPALLPPAVTIRETVNLWN